MGHSRLIFYGDINMEWTFEYWEEIKTLYIKTRGRLTANDANKMVADAVAAMSEHQCARQIVDHRATEFDLAIAEYYQRPSINEQIGISRKWKIAMVFKTLNENTQFMETVFKNRGYIFRQFSSLEEARDWVLDDK